jgi:hypothetical protein
MDLVFSVIGMLGDVSLKLPPRSLGLNLKPEPEGSRQITEKLEEHFQEREQAASEPESRPSAESRSRSA